jgi:ribosomal protein S18 acetylase RimI-like enzyme
MSAYANSPARRATPEDAEELVRLRKIMLDSMTPSDDTGWQPGAVEMLRERLADPDGDFAAFVVDRPDGMAGGNGGGADTSDRGGTDTGDHGGADTGDHGGAGPAGPGAARGAGPALAACAAGRVELRLPSPGNPLGISGHVFNVATDPDLRRRGYSRACMTALLAWYRERGVRKIDLYASEQGEPLYASLGFVRNAAPAMRLRY